MSADVQEMEEKKQTTVIRWASKDDKNYVHSAARKDNRSMSNFILNASMLEAERIHELEDYREDQYEEEDDRDVELDKEIMRRLLGEKRK